LTDVSRMEDLLGLVVCPLCKLDLTEHGAHLRCPSGHVFPVSRGVPRLVADWTGDASSISRSFGEQWRAFDYDEDRTWGASADERLHGFLGDIAQPAAWFKNKVVLDAGCGNGVLTHAISTLGCKHVLGCDISPSVEQAHRRFGDSVLFVQSDLMQPALRPAAFDVIYCGGVLHHSPSTRAALEQLVEALAPGGTIYVWLYWKVSSRSYRIKSALRKVLSPLPNRAKRTIILPLVAIASLRDRSLTWRDHFLVQVDFFTPRYRWEHTPDEVEGWMADLGLRKMTPHGQSRDGFGMRAERPPAGDRAPRHAPEQSLAGGRDSS
jgi:2-polyprenyl-3-methyl-5-hydroxy-6-metoxy-1,4-benzoquinol methylase/uncharacterized protein YbaR (Trm112 family)